jgi:hypothetical protein
MTQHAFLLKTIRRVLDGEGAPSPPSTHTSGSTEVDRLERRLREVDYIVGNEDSLDSEACAALRAVIFDIPDPRRPAIPDPVEIDPADYASPPSTLRQLAHRNRQKRWGIVSALIRRTWYYFLPAHLLIGAFFRLTWGWAEALFTVTALMCGNAQAFKTSAWVMADKLR